MPTALVPTTRSARLACASILALASAAATPAATVSAPAEVGVGAAFEVTWSGPAAQGDFISVDPAGAPEREYGSYVYAAKGSPVSLRAPGTTGDYAVRYHSGGSGYPVLASAPVRVVPVTATLEAPATVERGGSITVAWTGPANEGDFISVDPAGAADREYGAYGYTSKGSPLEIPAPAGAGRYEVRYHLGVSGYPVIGTAALTVGAAAATVEAPARANAGSTLSITWTGPDNPRDFISIDPAGAPPQEYGRYAYTDAGSPLAIPVPDAPGRYEVRYHLGAGGYPVIGSTPLEVGAVTATVEPRQPIVAGEPFEVAWSGPDNEVDFITVVPAGTAEREYGSYAYTRRGNPLRIEAPAAPGDYEVRYLTGQERRLLASAPIEVRPGKARGSLRVIGGGEAWAGGVAAVEVILDASGSMLQRLEGTRRIELARDALGDLVGATLPDGVPFALRVFGHREADSCRTDLEIPLAPLDRARATAAIRAVEPKNLAKTPIADSLLAVRRDLAAASGPKLVVLVTDGEETCDGDPAAAIRELAAGGVEVRVNIVGFAIDELMLKEEFESWARLGGGRYFDATDGAVLRRAVRGAIRETFEALADGEVVAGGTVGGDPVELPVGEYRVRTSSGEDLGTVAIVAGEETAIPVGG
jgi:hypothetical protein